MYMVSQPFPVNFAFVFSTNDEKAVPRVFVSGYLLFKIVKAFQIIYAKFPVLVAPKVLIPSADHQSFLGPQYVERVPKVSQNGGTHAFAIPKADRHKGRGC